MPGPWYIAAQGARHDLTAFAQVRIDDARAVGCTALFEPRTWPGRDELAALEIGWTWLSASAQGTGINTEAKLLLFTHCFESMGLARVDIKTDARNERSRQALARLGIQFEGVLRSWSSSRVVGEEGLLRDSAMYSVVAAEWPTVKAAMAVRLAAQRQRTASAPFGS